MVAVGEESGQVEKLLDEVADFYEREVDYDLKTLGAKIEPILIPTQSRYPQKENDEFEPFLDPEIYR